MQITKTTNYGSLFLFLTFIGVIIIIFYNYLTTPNFQPLPFLVVVFWLMITGVFEFGEFLGAFMKRKNFQTEGGLIGVYHKHVDHPSGMSEYFITTQKRYAEFVGYEDFQEGNAVARFLTRLTNSRMISIIDHAYMFDHVNDSIADVPEGAIIYRGTLRKGVKVLSSVEVLKVKLVHAYSIISEFATIAEKAKAVSEQTAQAQSKDIVEAVIKVGTAIQNMPMSKSQQQYPPMDTRGV